MLERAGKDPFILDRRPFSELMNDEIPYRRWAEEKKS